MYPHITLFLFFSLFIFAKGVPAGTQIINIAYLEYEIGDQTYHATSNTLIDTVDQLVDMRLSCMESEEVAVSSGQKAVPFRFLLSNLGNGEDSFELNFLRGSSSSFDVSNAKIYIDNGNDIFDTQDQLVTNITLQHDATQVLFLVSDIPSSAQGLSKNGIEALSKVQSSEGFRDHNYSVVVATQSGANIDYCSYKASSLWLELVKSVTPPHGSTVSQGDTIHYAIEVKVVGEGVVQNVVIEDAIPQNTEYIPNSLKLNSITQGEYKEGRVAINIAQIEQRANLQPKNIIEFDVKVK